MTNEIPYRNLNEMKSRLLVQYELLKLGVESFPPLFDSGTDLVSFYNSGLYRTGLSKTLQLKSREDTGSWGLDASPERTFDLYIFIKLNEEKSWIFSKEEIELKFPEGRVTFSAEFFNGHELDGDNVRHYYSQQNPE